MDLTRESRAIAKRQQDGWLIIVLLGLLLLLAGGTWLVGRYWAWKHSLTPDPLIPGWVPLVLCCVLVYCWRKWRP